MMNLKMNTQNNQGQAMDYFVGDYEKDTLIELLNLAKEHNVNYQNIGENYLFESNYKGKLVVIEDEGKVFCDDKDYKAILVVAEEIYYKGDFHTNYGLLLTNDDKKIEKFKAYVQADKLSDENDLCLNTQKLEGKIYPSWRERRDMALNGMYLG